MSKQEAFAKAAELAIAGQSRVWLYRIGMEYNLRRSEDMEKYPDEPRLYRILIGVWDVDGSKVM